MSLPTGSRLGAYEVLGSLGAGGMGEVYRARDTKLGRDVAIKVLPPAFASDPARVARFEREARTLAALNHPNIAQIYDAGKADAVVFLAMELVDGEDLRELLARGAVPVPEALKIARQIAAALETAHDAGIVHRDLKPANVKVRGDGVVKVLDFGLAKSGAADASGALPNGLSNSPTITSPVTELGMILGTAAYMSPEQARGKPVDRRADVWAFGVVLYEMLTGQRAFQGAEVSDVLASVLKDTLPLDRLPAETPASIRRLLRRCLQKDRGDRLDSMASARLEIADALEPASAAGDSSAVAVVPAATPSSRWNWLVTAALVAVMTTIAWWIGTRSNASPVATDARVVQFSIQAPGVVRDVAITPDGETFFIVTDRIYVRRLADATARALPGTDGARSPFVSPDGRWLGFYADGKMKKVAISGGDPLNILDIESDTPGAGWGPDNTVLYSSGWNSALSSVSAEGGGKPVSISTVDAAAGERAHWWPQLLPDQKTVLFTIWMAASGLNDAKLGLLDLSTGKHRVLMAGAAGRYTSSGHLIYTHAGKYHAVTFDPVAKRVTGDPIDVMPDGKPPDPRGSREALWARADDGTLFSVIGQTRTDVIGQLSWVTPQGSVTRIPIAPGPWNQSDLADDGRTLVTSRLVGGTFGVWLYDLMTQNEQRIELPGANFSTNLCPGGGTFLFTALRHGHFDVGQYFIDEQREKTLIDDPLDQEPIAFAHDCARFVLTDYKVDGIMRLTWARVDQPKQRMPLDFNTTVDEVSFAPDDKWMAVSQMVAGRMQIVVRPFPTGGPVVNITPRGGEAPIWPKTGSKIFYRRANEIVAVTYSLAGGRFAVEREDVVVQLSDFTLIGVAPDGRFLISSLLPGQMPEARVTLKWRVN